MINHRTYFFLHVSVIYLKKNDVFMIFLAFFINFIFVALNTDAHQMSISLVRYIKGGKLKIILAYVVYPIWENSDSRIFVFG